MMTLPMLAKYFNLRTTQLYRLNVRQYRNNVKSFNKIKKEEKGPWNPSSQKLNAKPVDEDDTIPIETSSPNLYTSKSLSPEYDLSKLVGIAASLFSYETEYISPASLNYKLPNENVPEFAFIGRSNVGKSSLIDCLLGNKSLARISKEPGCTRSVNFYGYKKKIPDKDKVKQHVKAVYKLFLVDLPGYGFAKVSKSEMERWRGIIDDYILNRNMDVLKRVFILIDSRQGVKQIDIDMMLRLNSSGIVYQVILTKADLSTQNEVLHSLKSTLAQLHAKRQSSGLPYIYLVSSVTGQGIATLKAGIAEVCNPSINLFSSSDVKKQLESNADFIPNNEDMTDEIYAALKANIIEEEEYAASIGIAPSDDDGANDFDDEAVGVKSAIQNTLHKSN